MTKLPTPPRLTSERERFFRYVYDRALTQQEHIVDLYFLHSQNPEFSVREHAQAWQNSGFGRLIEHIDSYGQHSLSFSLNEDGVKKGDQLVRQARAKSFRARLARNFWPAFNGIGTWLAAIAAIIAAYLSYLAVQR